MVAVVLGAASQIAALDAAVSVAVTSAVEDKSAAISVADLTSAAAPQQVAFAVARLEE